MSAVETDELLSFYAGLPAWVADAGLSEEAAVQTADDLEALVEFVQQAGYPPVEVDGPDPSSFPPPSDRIAGAANQLHGLLRGLDPAGWDTAVNGTNVAERCAATRSLLTERSATSN